MVCWHSEDLRTYDVEWVEPISTDYRSGYSFHEIPPNGQGLVALMALNIVRGFDLQGLGYGSPDYWHLLIEATKLSFADAEVYIGDPRMSSLPVTELLSEEYACIRRTQISMEYAQDPIPGSPSNAGDTVYLTVADKDGNLVSWIRKSIRGLW